MTHEDQAGYQIRKQSNRISHVERSPLAMIRVPAGALHDLLDAWDQTMAFQSGDPAGGLEPSLPVEDALSQFVRAARSEWAT